MRKEIIAHLVGELKMVPVFIKDACKSGLGFGPESGAAMERIVQILCIVVADQQYYAVRIGAFKINDLAEIV